MFVFTHNKGGTFLLLKTWLQNGEGCHERYINRENCSVQNFTMTKSWVNVPVMFSNTFSVQVPTLLLFACYVCPWSWFHGPGFETGLLGLKNLKNIYIDRSYADKLYLWYECHIVEEYSVKCSTLKWKQIHQKATAPIRPKPHPCVRKGRDFLCVSVWFIQTPFIRSQTLLFTYIPSNLWCLPAVCLQSCKVTFHRVWEYMI